MFTPVAWPVSSGVTASRIRFGIAAKASPMPVDITRFQTMISSWVPWASAISSRPADVMIAPSASGTREPKRVPSTPESGPATSITSAPGTISRPAPVASSPKP